MSNVSYSFTEHFQGRQFVWRSLAPYPAFGRASRDNDTGHGSKQGLWLYFYAILLETKKEKPYP